MQRRLFLGTLAGTLAASSLLNLRASRAEAAVQQVPCPVSLTNPDGQAMVLEKYDLRIAVHGPLSLTEMEMVFRNPEQRQMEGRFLYTLPSGATISRFAKDVNGKLMEGEVVEKLRAQSIYTEILHTMRDPALLEMDQGNRFSARVFPIPAAGTVRLVLGFSQMLPAENGARSLTIPLAGLPKINNFRLDFHYQPAAGESVGANKFLQKDPTTFEERDFVPQGDVELKFSLTHEAQATRAVKAGNYQMLAYHPKLPSKAMAPHPTDWTFYIDTSASNADFESRRLAALEPVLNKLVPVLRDGDRKFNVFAFDLAVSELLPTVSMNTKGGRPIMPEVITKLRARHALGATNLHETLKHIGEQARAAKEPRTFVLVTDGIATFGPRDVIDVLAAIGDWPSAHTLHALVIGSKQDAKMLAAITERTLGRVINLPLADDLQPAVDSALSLMQKPMGATFEFYDEGAEWIYPKSFRDVHPGSELIVFSELKAGAPSKPGVVRPMDGKKSDETVKVAATEIPDYAPLLQREAVRAQLDHLEKCEQSEKVPGRVEELRKQRLDLSTRNRVMCPLTSLLVLETEDDYRRCGIERTSLADIMQVGAKGIELRKRGADEMPPPVAAAKNNRKEGMQSPRKAAVDDPAAPEQLEKSRDLALYAVPGDAKDDAAQPQRRRALRDELAEATESEGLIRGGGGGEGRPHPFAVAPGTRATTVAAAAASPAPQNQDGRNAAPAEQSIRERNGLAPAQAGKLAEPEWKSQYKRKPAETDLNTLRSQVRAMPRDRNARNAYSDALCQSGEWDSLQGEVFEWLPFDPENSQVFEYLGKSATGLNDAELSLRAYTSIAEVAPNRAALLSRAGWLLLAAAIPADESRANPNRTKQLEWAVSLFNEALKNRKDDCNVYRGLALAQWMMGNFEAAVATYENALSLSYHQRYGDAKRVLREECSYVCRAWMNAGGNAAAITERAAKLQVDLKWNDAFRATLCWETDANDVDLHVIDPSNEECFYGHNKNVSGLELYSDQTQGLGPEVIRCGKALSGTYHVGVNYFNAGAMGVSRGVVVTFQPRDGQVGTPQVVPFCLVPKGPPMRHLCAAAF